MDAMAVALIDGGAISPSPSIAGIAFDSSIAGIAGLPAPGSGADLSIAVLFVDDMDLYPPTEAAGATGTAVTPRAGWPAATARGGGLVHPFGRPISGCVLAVTTHATAPSGLTRLSVTASATLGAEQQWPLISDDFLCKQHNGTTGTARESRYPRYAGYSPHAGPAVAVRIPARDRPCVRPSCGSCFGGCSGFG